MLWRMPLKTLEEWHLEEWAWVWDSQWQIKWASQYQINLQHLQRPPPIPKETEYYAAVNGKQEGPFPMSKIEEMIKNNEVSSDTLFWKEGMANWSPAKNCPELMPLFKSVPPPLPPH